MRRIQFLGTFLAILTCAPGAWTGPNKKTAWVGRSIGTPSEGKLEGGAHLPSAPFLRVLPSTEAGDARWGIPALVDLVVRAAKATNRDYPGTIATIGQLSRREGGDIEGHASHESGRDADVAFFARDVKGKSVYAPHYVAFRADGSAPTWPGAMFDDARNWAFVKHVLTDSEVRVSRIFVASHIRARLLRFAESAGESFEIRDRAAETMTQPAWVLPHDDHFHVRISCPSGMTGCIENPLGRHSRRPNKSRGPLLRVRARSANFATGMDARAADSESVTRPTDDNLR